MKKNIRFVSAAAAALLAVAPVVASTVSTVSAADGTTQVADGSTTAPYVSTLPTTVKAISATFNPSKVATASDALKGTSVTVKLDNANASVAASIDSVSEITSLKNNKGDSVLDSTSNLQDGRYTATVKATLSGLAKNAHYKFGNTVVATNDKGVTTDPVELNLSVFVTNTNATEAYFVNVDSNQQIANGGTLGQNVAISNYTVANVLANAEAQVTTSPNSEITTTTDDVKKQLTNQGFKVADNGSFDGAGKKFNITLTVKNYKSGNTATVVIPFYNKDQAYSAYPIIQFRSNGSNGNWENLQQGEHEYRTTNAAAIVLQQNTSDDTASTQFKPTNYFRALINSNNKNSLTALKVTENNVDVKKAGVYSVTVEATNNAGNTTKVTVPVYVNGINGVVKSVVTKAGYPVQTYQIINDKAVADINNQADLYNGSLVATFDTKTVDGVEYTRIVSSDSNIWVKSSDLQEAKSSAIQTGTVKVMHNAYVYDKKGTRVGTKKIATYSEIPVYGTETINGKKYYRISSDKEEYVNAGNIDGTKRVLKHNAYIYATSKKRANKTTLKKGESVTTYGSAVTFKNGKQYYRIEGCTASNKMYVKKANF